MDEGAPASPASAPPRAVRLLLRPSAMRPRSLFSAALPFASFFACLVPALAGCRVTVGEPDPGPTDPTPAYTVAATSQPTTPPPAKTATPTATPTVVDESTFAEVVHVYMRDGLRGMWFCTGTLVAKDVVVTAAHCLDTNEFVSYEIVAANAPGKPRIKGTKPASFGGPYAEVANPDIGFLKLESPVTLPRYAELTDVTARVDAGDAVKGAALIRTAEQPTASFAMSSTFDVSSAVELGYEHGFATAMFTKGGDSGAGLFLVENGKVTHKLIGVARQPEPARNLDHFTRIDADFTAWFAATSAP